MAKITKSLSAKVSKETGKSEILLRFIGGRYLILRGKSNIFIKPDRWSDERGEVKTSRLDPDTIKAQTKLSELCTSIAESFSQLSNPTEEATKEWLAEVIDHYHYPEKYAPKEVEPETLFEWIDKFITKIAPTRKDRMTGRLFARNSIQQLNATYKHLRALAALSRREDYRFSEVNIKLYDSFVEYLQDLDFTANTIGKHIKVLKLIINEAPIELRAMADISGFSVFSEDIDNIYLDKAELQQLKDADFSNAPYLDRVRDWFLLLAWTGCRFSDLTKIMRTDIKDGYITFRQQKTNEKVTIPLHPVVVEILEKYDFDMPEPISNQRFNEYIKEVGAKAGICSEESVTRTVGGRKVTTTHPKYELICSHTGRRSFATNMYKDKFPSIMIMSITGHKTERNFLTYIKVSQEEHAKMVKEEWDKMYKKQ